MLIVINFLLSFQAFCWIMTVGVILSELKIFISIQEIWQTLREKQLDAGWKAMICWGALLSNLIILSVLAMAFLFLLLPELI